MRDKYEGCKNIVANEVIMNASTLVEDLLSLKYTGGIMSDRLMDIENEFIDSEDEAKELGFDSLESMQESGDDIREIFEWWFVTEWLYHHLRQRNEPVMVSDYGYIWGRTTTGQPIAADPVIEDIWEYRQSL